MPDARTVTGRRAGMDGRTTRCVPRIPEAIVIWTARRAGRRRRLGRARALPRRGDLGRLDGRRRPRLVRHRLPLLRALHRAPRPEGRQDPGHARPNASTTASTSTPPTGGCCSATTSRRSPAPGPLVGPVLAAQMGYLPGTIWIIAASSSRAPSRTWSCCSSPRGATARSLGQMARDEIGPVGGAAALIAVFAIMIILLGGAGAGRRQRPRRVAVGHLLHRA